MRALESAVSATNRLKAREGWTDKFIFPPYDFKICNAMITNFHMPESTLLMMASAFAGYDLAMEAYKVAKKEKYKFLTYGDAMLIVLGYQLMYRGRISMTANVGLQAIDYGYDRTKVVSSGRGTAKSLPDK